jgi:hypothetical protein
LGVTAAYVSDILKHRRGLSENIARALGFKPIPSPPPPAQLYTQMRGKPQPRAEEK